MPERGPLNGSFARVLRDVAATTDVRLEVTAWPGPDTSIAWVVHEAGVRPHQPVWETFRLLKQGDSIAMHPMPPEDQQSPGYGDADDITITVAGAVQDMTQMVLWRRGLDSTWPACPAHPGGHPLRIMGRSMSWMLKDGKPVIEHDTGAMWACPRDGITIPIGHLA